MSVIGPLAEGETGDYYAACPACGSRMTHRREADTWHCHGCGHHWRDPDSYEAGLPVDDDLLMEECDTEPGDLWE